MDITPEQHIRLEVLKIAHRPDKDAQTNIERMSELERFVLLGKEPKGDAAPTPVAQEEQQQEKPEKPADKTARNTRQG